MTDRIQDAVQPARWYDALPRSSFAKYDQVPHSQPWFEVYRLPGDVLCIYEPGHFQEVISFLVSGRDRALLFDTGMGIGDMNSLVRELTDLELTVVNSHCHFDHIGCNWQFPEVHVFDHPATTGRLARGMEHEDVGHHLDGDSTCIPYPDVFDPNEYAIRPSNPRPIPDGHVFELGQRALRVIHTPGHSPGSIMLLDEAGSILFTGDTYYPATMYAHLSSRDGVNSNFSEYVQTMRRLADEVDVKWLYASHNEPVQPGATLGEVASAFSAIASAEEEKGRMVRDRSYGPQAGAPAYQIDGEGLRKYTFDGFAIVTLDPPHKNSQSSDPS